MTRRFRDVCAWAVIVASAVALGTAIPGPANAQSTPAGNARTIVFVCLHGVANSQMAAAYFNKAAKERGLPYTAISRGIELYPTIPVRILDGLAIDGLDPANSPRALTAADVNGANRVLAFDAVPAERSGKAAVTYWSGVPLGASDYDAAREEIVRRIDDLIPSLTKDEGSAGAGPTTTRRSTPAFNRGL